MSSYTDVLTNIFRVASLRNGLILAALFVLALPIYENFVDYPRFSRLLLSTVEDEATRTANHFVSMLLPDVREFSADALPKDLHAKADMFERDFGLEKIKIFAPSGEIIHSSDPLDEGTVNTRDYFTNIVAAGRGYTKIVEKQSRSLEGQIYAADVVETYVPIMDGNKFIGAFEIYYDITTQLKLLDKLKLQSTGTALALALGLFAMVLVLTFRASRNMLMAEETASTLRQAQKMQSLGNLAAGIAHEMNNLLLPIMALSQMTLKRLPEESPLRESMRKIIEASERGKALVEQVMAFNRAEETKQQHLDIHDVLSGSIGFLRSSLLSTVTLTTDLNGHIGTICGDASQIGIVVMNLVSNAQDAMGGKAGSIQISLRSIEVENGSAIGLPMLDSGSYAKLSVADTGCGMGADSQNRAFDPFFTTKEVGKGVGLGLTTAYTIVNNHNGAISIASRPGIGTTVDVYLPLVRKDAER